MGSVRVGRNYSLFAGCDAGGSRAAGVYSVIGTAKLSGVDQQAYRREVFARVADHPVNRIDELQPWNLEILPTADQAAPDHRSTRS